MLSFDRACEIVHGRRVRRSRFERRSSLPVSAACLTANAMRETLGALLGGPASLRLLEPRIPDDAAWSAISRDAQLFAVRGPAADAVLVLRAGDALALATAAFGEPAGAVRPLSTVENEVVLRAVRALAGSLAPICGRELSPVERILDIRACTTYFELLVERPAELRLGVALSRDPQAPAAGALRIDDLMDVEVEVRVEFARGSLSAAEFVDLRPGADVPMMTRVGDPGLLRAGGTVLARGECGALGARSAFAVCKEKDAITR